MKRGQGLQGFKEKVHERQTLETNFPPSIHARQTRAFIEFPDGDCQQQRTDWARSRLPSVYYAQRREIINTEGISMYLLFKKRFYSERKKERAVWSVYVSLYHKISTFIVQRPELSRGSPTYGASEQPPVFTQGYQRTKRRRHRYIPRFQTATPSISK